MLGSNPWFKKARGGGIGKSFGSPKALLGRERSRWGGDNWGARPGVGDRTLMGGAQSMRNGRDTRLWADRYCAPRRKSLPRGERVAQLSGRWFILGVLGEFWGRHTE